MCKYIDAYIDIFFPPQGKGSKWIFFSLSLAIMFLPLQADEKGQHFLVPSQAVKLRQISHPFLTDLLTKDGDAGRMHGGSFCTEHAVCKQEVQAW